MNFRGPPWNVDWRAWLTLGPPAISRHTPAGALLLTRSPNHAPYCKAVPSRPPPGYRIPPIGFWSFVVVRPSQALALHRREIRELVERNRARNPRIFGSVLHGRDTETSDLDVLVDPVPGATLLDLGGLQVLLEELLGVQVDLLTPGDLPQRARDRVLGEAIPI